MRCVQLYMLEAAECELCLPEVLEAMRCMLWTVALFAGDVRGAGGAGGDAPYAALYAGGCGGWVLFTEALRGVGGAGGDAALYAGRVRDAGGAGGDALYATLYAGGSGG